MSAVTIVFAVLQLISGLALTVIVLMQEGKSAGLGSIGGIGDSYWGKNKSRSMEGNMVKITKILAAAFLLIALALNMIPDKKTSTTTPVTAQTEAMTEQAAVAQSVERHIGNVEVTSSILVSSFF